LTVQHTHVRKRYAQHNQPGIERVLADWHFEFGTMLS